MGVMYTKVGTKIYMAPEILENRPYRGTSVDIFSAGVVLFNMMTGGMPFSEKASINDSLYKYLIDKNYSKYWAEWEKSQEDYVKHKINALSSDFKDLI